MRGFDEFPITRREDVGDEEVETIDGVFVGVGGDGEAVVLSGKATSLLVQQGFLEEFVEEVGGA